MSNVQGPSGGPKPPHQRVDRHVGSRKAQNAAARSSVRATKRAEGAVGKKVKPKKKASPAQAPKPQANKPQKAKKPSVHGHEHHEPEPDLDPDGPDPQELHPHHVHVHLELDVDPTEDEEFEEHDTGATGPDAIKRSRGDGGSGGGDGFGGEDKGREAYEKWLRGNVSADAKRIDELKKKGARDDFNPERSAAEVESLGTTRATAHLVRLYEMWTLEGVKRDEAIEKAAAVLSGFGSVQSIRRVLAELEVKPIRDVYPLEVVLKMLDEHPELLPGVRVGSVVSGLEERTVIAGVPVALAVPQDARIKSFALLGGGRPGYEFHPHQDEGKYQLLVDTPGHYTMAVLAAPLQELGKIKRETNEAIIELFQVTVYAMGKKGEPLSPEEWEELQQAENDDDLDEMDGLAHLDDDDEEELEPALPAPPLPVQIRTQLERIARDDDSPAAATTYSWDASFYKPGAPMDDEPVLHLVVEKAGPFDVAWVRAREALAAKQKELEPSRAVVTAEDFTAALRRARVR